MTSLTKDLRLSVQHTTCQLAFKEAEGPYAPSLHTRPLIVQRSAVWVGACAQMQAASGKVHTWLDLGRLAGLSVLMSRLWLELMSRAMLGQCCCGPAAAPSPQCSLCRPASISREASKSSRLDLLCFLA